MAGDPSEVGVSQKKVKVADIRSKKLVNVWASKLGAYTPNKEYPVVISFTDFNSLVQHPKMISHKGAIKKLILNAHGNYPGVFDAGLGEPDSSDDISQSESTEYFKPTPERLTLQNTSLHYTFFKTLERFLTKNGELIFLSCITGQGYNGADFLKQISSWMPGKTVIGFTTFLYYSPRDSNPAGDVWDLKALNIADAHVRREKSNKEFQETKKTTLKLFNINANTAKWAKNGKIVRTASLDNLMKSDIIEIPIRSTKPVPKKYEEAYRAICREWSGREWTIINLEINLARNPGNYYTDTIKKSLMTEQKYWLAEKEKITQTYSDKLGHTVKFIDFQYKRDLKSLQALRKALEPYKDKTGYPCTPQAVAALYRKIAAYAK
jgi:hypothetical protein